MISRLHYITQEDIAGISLIDLTENALKGGVDWVQLRMKKASYDEFLENAKVLRNLTRQYGAKLIINDNIQIASEVDADGVHLGLDDAPVHDARLQLGVDKIVGGTCNSLEDIIRRSCENVDYIGLGPLHFTSTKSALSPLLGFDGFQDIFNNLKGRNILTPIIGIGGIEVDDVHKLTKMGVYGIAIASLINREKNPTQTIQNLKTALDLV